MTYLNRVRRWTVCVLFVLLACSFLGVTGCKDTSTVTYHNEAHGFSISMDKELADAVFVNDSMENGAVYFTYVLQREGEATDFTSDLNWICDLFRIYIDPVEGEPREGAQWLGSSEKYNYYMTYFSMPCESMAAGEAYEKYKDKINLVAATFRLDP